MPAVLPLRVFVYVKLYTNTTEVKPSLSITAGLFKHLLPHFAPLPPSPVLVGVELGFCLDYQEVFGTGFVLVGDTVLGRATA